MRHLSDKKYQEIADQITRPDKFYYSNFSDFTPLEFEHFCGDLLELEGYKILESNTDIAPDDGVDLVAIKNNKLIIVQVKKSDYVREERDYITLSSVDRLMGTMSRVGPKFLSKYKTDGNDLEINGYFLTLKRFSNVVLAKYIDQKTIKLIDFVALRKLIAKHQHKQLEIVIWQDQDIQKLKTEIKELESKIADIAVEIDTLENKISFVERYVLSQTIDLNRYLKLKQNLLLHLQATFGKVKQGFEDIEFANKQNQAEQDFDKLQSEILKSKIKVLTTDESAELKKIYKRLVHQYHPDKNYENKDKYHKISAAINFAKNAQDIEMLKKIEMFPEKYLEMDMLDDFNQKPELANYLESLQNDYDKLVEKHAELIVKRALKSYQTYITNPNDFEEYIKTIKESINQKIKDIEDQISGFVDNKN